jgi:hypothetical protein
MNKNTFTCYAAEPYVPLCLPNKKTPFETPQLQNNYSETTTTISSHARLSVLLGKLMSHFLLDNYIKGLHLRLLYSPNRAIDLAQVAV